MAIKYCLSPKILTSCQTFKPSDLQLPRKSTGCLLTLCKMQSVRRMGYLTKHGIPYCIIQSLETLKIFFLKKANAAGVLRGTLESNTPHLSLRTYHTSSSLLPLVVPESLLAKKFLTPFPVREITYPFPSCPPCLQLGAQIVLLVHNYPGKSSVAPIKFRNK